ncbi:hypothetical protein D3C75_776350 [compost metagenome]
MDNIPEHPAIFPPQLTQDQLENTPAGKLVMGFHPNLQAFLRRYPARIVQGLQQLFIMNRPGGLIDPVGEVSQKQPDSLGLVIRRHLHQLLQGGGYVLALIRLSHETDGAANIGYSQSRSIQLPEDLPPFAPGVIRVRKVHTVPSQLHSAKAVVYCSCDNVLHAPVFQRQGI